MTFKMPKAFGISMLAVFQSTLLFAQSYTVTDLGLPAGSQAGSASEAHGVNRNGSVVGTWWSGGSSQGSQYGFVYSGGTMFDLGALKSGGYDYSIAYAINTNQTVGQSTTTGGNYHAFVFTNNTMTDLGGGAWASANAINQAGQIVGEFTTSTNASVIHAFIYTNGAMRDLGSLGGTYSSAKGINDSGVIVGEASDAIGNIYAFVYSNNVMTSLGTLGGTYSSAHAINNSGVIVGESAVANGEIHAFICTNGVMTDLGTFGGTNSSAWAISSSGRVAGYANDANQVSHSFVYSGSGLLNLDTVLPPGASFTNLALAYGMNDLGQIVGGGFTTGGAYHAFLVTPPAIALTCSTNVTVVAPTEAGVVVNFNLTAIGGCSAPTVVANPPSGSTFPVGTNTVNVTAYDLCGHTNTCSFSVIVKPPASPVTAVSPTVNNGQFQLTILGVSGQRFAILSSSNLLDWQWLVTNTLVSGSTNFTDSLTNTSRFYRAATLP